MKKSHGIDTRREKYGKKNMAYYYYFFLPTILGVIERETFFDKNCYLSLS